MMSHVATAILASSMLFSFTAIPTPEKPVALKGTIQPSTTSADNFTITVEFDIKDGWHTYAEVGDAAQVRTSLELNLPEGVKSASDWNRPAGIEGNALNSEIHVEKVLFSKSVVVDPSAYGKNIEVVVAYQACTDDRCNRPQNKTVSIAIPAKASTDRSIFENPVRINADGKPLNTAAKKRFVSPAIFDVDGDGKTELVIGSLMGSVGVYENLNTSRSGDPVWGPQKSLKDAKGEQIRTSNW